MSNSDYPFHESHPAHTKSLTKPCRRIWAFSIGLAHFLMLALEVLDHGIGNMYSDPTRKVLEIKWLDSRDD